MIAAVALCDPFWVEMYHGDLPCVSTSSFEGGFVLVLYLVGARFAVYYYLAFRFVSLIVSCVVSSTLLLLAFRLASSHLVYSVRR